MRIGAQPREFHAGFHGFEGERIYLDGIEYVFAAAERREKVINPAKQDVATEFPGMSLAFDAEGLRHMQTMLPGLARKNR